MSRRDIADPNADHNRDKNRRAERFFPQPDRNRAGKEPCGECRLRVGEICGVCGASTRNDHWDGWWD